MSIERLPAFGLDTSGSLGARLRALGIGDFRRAAGFVRDLPYGRNSDSSDWGLVLAEGRGTCSTKHALLAALAHEHGADVELRLGVYLMAEMGQESLRIVARHDIGKTLSTFEELYEMVLSSYEGPEARGDAMAIADAGGRAVSRRDPTPPGDEKGAPVLAGSPYAGSRR